MRKPFFICNLLVVGVLAATSVKALPASNSPRTTSTPLARTRTARASQGARQSTTVVIDAGHGGYDRGGIAGQRVDEKTMNLDVALRHEKHVALQQIEESGCAVGTENDSLAGKRRQV